MENQSITQKIYSNSKGALEIHGSDKMGESLKGPVISHGKKKAIVERKS